MKKAIAFIFLFISVLTYGQDTSQVRSKKERRFYFGVNFSGDLCSGILAVKPIFDNIDAKAVSKFGYTSGINFCYVITKKFSLNIGVQYSQKNYDIKTNLTFGDTIDRRRGFVYSTSAYPSNENRYHYLDIPIVINFVTGKYKTRFICGLGVTANIFIKETSASFVVGSKTTPINISPSISAGIEYKINNRMFFRIEPTFRYGALKVSTNLATQYLWNTGINCSFYF